MSSEVRGDRSTLPEVEGDRAAHAVTVSELQFAYPGGSLVLDIPELCIASGERVFLYGPSGSGKSTLLSLIAGVLQPTAGQIDVLGHPFATMRAAARDRVRGAGIGYVFQSFNLIPYLSVGQNISLPCDLHHERLQQVRERTLPQEVERLARRLDILPLLSQPISKLSVGQQQRVAIARALIGSPPLIIADEPTSSLDADRRDRFIALLLDLVDETRAAGRPTTLIYVSHDLSLQSLFSRNLSLPALNRASSSPGQEHPHATA